MIKKTIHYCWFGGSPLSKLAKKCIRSWEKYCPDYKIVRWDESNFNINYSGSVVKRQDGKNIVSNTYCRLLSVC